MTEAKAMGQRAREFYNTDTFIPPELIYLETPENSQAARSV